MIVTTEKELNQLHYINKEIEVLKSQLDELKSKSLVKGQEITGMPHVPGVSDKTAQIAVAIREIEELYETDDKQGLEDEIFEALDCME